MSTNHFLLGLISVIIRQKSWFIGQVQKTFYTILIERVVPQLQNLFNSVSMLKCDPAAQDIA